MVEWKPAPNIAQIKQTVLTTPGLTFLGDIGNAQHLAGTGDHTPWSTHNGKLGTPTRGEVHAIDIGMSDTLLDQFETFVRRSWRRGELGGIKYLNVLNRQWNIQSETSWNRAKNGTITSTYNGDHHVHLSMENGGIDGDILARFNTWRNNGQQFPNEEDDMAWTDMLTADNNAGQIAVGTNVGIYTLIGEVKESNQLIRETLEVLQEISTKLTTVGNGGVDVDELATKISADISQRIATK